MASSRIYTLDKKMLAGRLRAAAFSLFDVEALGGRGTFFHLIAVPTREPPPNEPNRGLYLRRYPLLLLLFLPSVRPSYSVIHITI